MPREVYLVKVGMTMTEGLVTEWYIADGQQVSKGDMLYTLETEKINLDVDAEASGTVKHAVEVGVTLEPGAIVGYIFEAGEDITDVSELSSSSATTESEGKTVEQPAVSKSSDSNSKSDSSNDRVKSSPAARRLARELGIDYKILSGTGRGGRIDESDVRLAKQALTENVAKASPLAKRLAIENGVDIASVTGTGPHGRIVQADIEAAVADLQNTTPNAASDAGGTSVAERIPITGMRKTIATRMFSSLQNSAQLSMDMEALMGDAIKLRKSLIEEWQDEGIRPTYTDLVIKAVAKALKKHPMMNSQMGATEITLMDEVNVGVAVALPEGLVVPVIRVADILSIKEIAVESARLASSARAGTLGLDDYAGGTFTVSALGMYGVDYFTPIINEPQAGILGVNRIYDGIEWNEEVPVRTSKMNLSLTWDHRVIDGAPAAEFLAEIRELLSNPFRLLV
jgi:pyruvate dehydrogenase E2 component (dihydrolipoamide acetyltransferase)